MGERYREVRRMEEEKRTVKEKEEKLNELEEAEEREMEKEVKSGVRKGMKEWARKGRKPGSRHKQATVEEALQIIARARQGLLQTRKKSMAGRQLFLEEAVTVAARYAKLTADQDRTLQEACRKAMVLYPVDRRMIGK
jgi:tRNA pseudouridine-54 N-methylase